MVAFFHLFAEQKFDASAFLRGDALIIDHFLDFAQQLVG